MNEEQLALQTLKALGAKDTTSNVQKKNGTTCFTLPTGSCISEHKTGYIRKNLLNKKGGIYTCYQLNPTYKTVEKLIGWKGKYQEFERNNRMLIWNRAERLKRLVSYAIKDINSSK
jgi:5,10-methylenetetrahydrofolate reductase